MSDTPIDTLIIDIEAKASNADDAIDKFAKAIGNLASSLVRVDTGKLNSVGNGIKKLSDSLQTMKSIDTRSINSIVNKINSLSAIDTSQFATVSANLQQMANGIQSLGTVSANVASVGELASNISKLGNKSVQTAVTNIPQLATALNGLMTTLSKAPRVSQNVIQMTNALANLSTQGSRVGSASNSIVKGLNKASASATKAKGSFKGLASAFGKFYANCFLVIRGVKSLWKSINSTADYLEAFNYFEVALNKVGSDWASDWEKYSEKLGVTSAEEYANSFKTRLNESLSGLSGLKIEILEETEDSKYGLLTDTGLKNLGLNIQEVTQYASQLASVTNSVGQTGEVTLATASAFTKLGADMSSLFNVDYSSVMNNLQSGLIGQSRALYKYGIDITNATLQTYAYKLGVGKAVSEMTQAEKMQLRMIAILDQSRVAWGDQANTINSLSNSIRQFKNNISEAGQILGQLFLPLMTKVMPIVNGLTIAIKRLMVSIAGLMGIEIDLEAFGQSGVSDEFESLTEEIDGATESANKFNKATRGWDELNVLGESDNDSELSTDGIDLTQQILDATAEYEKVWQEAYDRMQNKAEEFANTITSALEPVKRFFKLFSAKKIKKLTDAIKDFNDAIKPFATGFAEGFLRVFETLAEVSYEIIIDGLGKTAKVIGIFSGDSVKKAGEVFGVFVGSLVVASGIKSFSTIISGIKSIGTALSSNPILQTFALASGILTLINMANDTNYDSTNIDKFTERLGALKTKLLEAEDLKDGGAAQQLQIVYEKWNAIASKTGELTEGDEALLKTYGDMLKEICPSVTPFINENGEAFEGVQDEIQKAINKTLLWYKVQSAGDYLKALGDVEIELEIETDLVEEKIRELVDRIKELNPKISEETIYKYAENLAKGYGDATDILLGKEKEFGITRNFLGFRTKEGKAIYDEVTNAMTDLSELLLVQEEAIDELAEVKTKIDKAASEYVEKQKEYNEATKDSKNSIAEVAEELSNLKKTLNGLNGKRFVSELQVKANILDPYEVFKAVGSKQSNIKLPKYATGGFPEDGLFFANRTELVGQFSNGKTAVANNEQITKGIEEAAYRGMMRALNSSKTGSSATFEIVGDPNGMFKVMQKQASQYAKSTGRNAFA